MFLVCSRLRRTDDDCVVVRSEYRSACIFAFLYSVAYSAWAHIFLKYLFELLVRYQNILFIIIFSYATYLCKKLRRLIALKFRITTRFRTLFTNTRKWWHYLMRFFCIFLFIWKDKKKYAFSTYFSKSN